VGVGVCYQVGDGCNMVKAMKHDVCGGERERRGGVFSRPTPNSQHMHTHLSMSVCVREGRRTGSARIQGGVPLRKLQLLHPFCTCLFQPVYLPSHTHLSILQVC